MTSELLVIFIIFLLLLFFYLKNNKAYENKTTPKPKSDLTEKITKKLDITPIVEEVMTKQEIIEEEIETKQEEDVAKTEFPSNQETTEAAIVTTRADDAVITEYEEEELELNMDDLVNEFIEYVRAKKVVKLDDLSSRMNSKREDTVNRLRELEDHGQTFGFVDRTGKYINLNEKEMEFLEKILVTGKKKKMTRSDLIREFNTITGSTKS